MTQRTFTVRVGLLAGKQNKVNYTFADYVEMVFDGTPTGRFEVDVPMRDGSRCSPINIEILPGQKMPYGKRFPSGILGKGAFDLDCGINNPQDYQQLCKQLLRAGWKQGVKPLDVGEQFGTH